MKLFTKEIENRLQSQYPKGNSLDQMVICKIFNPYGAGTWYIMNQDPEDNDYLWGIVDLFEVEIGSFSKRDLEQANIHGIGHLERDLYFKPMKAKEVWDKLQRGEHV